MKCPHCQAEEPEGATECPSCGFIYAKWRAAQAGTNTPVPVARKEEESSPVVLWGGLAAAVLAYVFFFRQPAPAPASEAAPRQAQTGPAAPAQAAEPVPEGWWRLQGRVVDITRSKPVAGVLLVLKPGGARAVTDSNGLYQLSGAPIDGTNYVLDVTHPRFRPEHLSGSMDDVEHEYKARGGCPSTLDPETLSPRGGELVQRDFGLCPRR